MPIYDKNEVGRMARQYGFVRDTFEKVLRLTEVLRYMNEQEILRKKDTIHLEERKERAKDYITELLQLTDSEKEYIDRFIAKEYRPELLFEDDSIVKRVESHPMAIWKCR